MDVEIKQVEGGIGLASFEFTVKNPKSWIPEAPHLYYLRAEVSDGDGTYRFTLIRANPWLIAPRVSLQNSVSVCSFLLTWQRGLGIMLALKDRYFVSIFAARR